MAKIIRKTFRFDEQTAGMLRKLAELTNRSMTNYLETLIERDAEARGVADESNGNREEEIEEACAGE